MWDKAKAVKSIEYYYKQSRDSARERVKGHPKLTGNLRYYDNDATASDDETYGTWYTPRCFTAPPISNAIVHGARVEFEQLDKLSRAIDPETGDVLYKKAKGVNKVAEDIVNSIPKPFSVLNGIAKTAAFMGGPAAEFGALVSHIIESTHFEANNYGIEYIAEHGGIQVRTGKGSMIRQNAASFSVAQFTHFTSRRGDMQLHTHNVIPNVVRRPDGKFGSIDNYNYTKMRHEVSALYRARVTTLLKQRLGAIGIKISISKDGRNITIDGFPTELTSHFSKRRKDILKELAKWGIKGTADNRKAAQIAAYKTREDKDKLPPIEDLYRLWEVEAKSLGHTFESLMETIQMTAAKLEKEKLEKYERKRAKAKEDGIELPEVMPEYDLEEIKESSVNHVLEYESAFNGRAFKVSLLEELQVHVDADTALEIYEQVKDESKLIEIAQVGRTKEGIYTSERMLVMERDILDLTMQMQGNREAVDSAFLAKFFAEGIMKNDGSGDSFQLKPEQERVVAAMFGSNQMTAANGWAGTGKTTAMIMARRIAEARGTTVWIGGPTHRSVSILGQEVGIPQERRFAVAGIIAAYDKGELKIGPKDKFIIDEAGMIGTAQWWRLAKIAHETGAEFNFIGDQAQLPSVGAGAPLRMHMSFVGGETMEEIARQNVEWMLDCSKQVAQGDVAGAIEAYDDQGRIHVCNDDDDTFEKATDKYFEWFDKDPGATITAECNTNAEVARLNQSIRNRKIERGLLSGPAYDQQTVSRGKTPYIVTGSFMAGENFITGESLMLGKEFIPNNTFGTILSIEPDGENEPTWTVRIEDGRVLSFKPSEFVGFRAEDDQFKGIPRLTLSDAVTFYGSQGITARYNMMVGTSATSREATYVGFTRHKEDFAFFVDGGRHASALLSREGKNFTVSNTGGTRQDDDEAEGEVTRAQIIESLIAECEVSSGKTNACDYLGGAKNFYEAAKKIEREVGEEIEMTDEQGNRKRSFAIDRVVPAAKAMAAARAAEVGTTTKDNADKLEAMMTLIANAPGNGGAAKAKSDVYIPLAQSEIEIMTTENLVNYMTRNGAKQVGKPREVKDKSRNSTGGTALEYNLTFGKGLGAVVYHKANGTWGFFMRDGTKGDIRNFVIWRDGGDFKQACQKLRDEFNTFQHRDTVSNFKPQQEVKTETLRETFDRILSTPFVRETVAHIQRLWNGAKVDESPYLTNVRGITRATQSYYRAAFRNEGDTPYDAQREFSNKGGVMLAMRNQFLEVTGIVRKGDALMKNDKEELVPFNANIKGSVRHLIVGGDIQNPKRVYMGEAFFDAMSLSQKNGIREGDAAIGFGGSAFEAGLAQVYKIASENPDVEWIWVGQNDDADIVNELKAREAIREANGDCTMKAVRPPAEFKDWNDEIRGIVRPTPKAFPRQQVSFEDRQQAKARREGYGASDGSEATPPAPKGPEMGR